MQSIAYTHPTPKPIRERSKNFVNGKKDELGLKANNDF